MSSEIATWGMIRAKVSAFPAPAAGRENECLTKSEILSLGGENVRIEGSYGDGECVMLDNVIQNVITFQYEFSADNLYIPSHDGSTHTVNIRSYAYKYINGVYSSATYIPWVLDSPEREEIWSRDGGFGIYINSKGRDYLDVMIWACNAYVDSEDFATINLTQYIPTFPKLEIKVFISN